MYFKNILVPKQIFADTFGMTGKSETQSTTKAVGKIIDKIDIIWGVKHYGLLIDSTLFI